MRSKPHGESMRRVAALLGVLELARETTRATLTDLRIRIAHLERAEAEEDRRVMAEEMGEAPRSDRRPGAPRRLLLKALGELEESTAYLSVLDLQIEQIEAVRRVDQAGRALVDLVEQADELRETAPAKYREALIDAQAALSAALQCDDPTTALALCDQHLEQVRVTLAQRRDLGIRETAQAGEQIGLGL